MHRFIHIYIHTYTHTHIHTYMYIHIYIYNGLERSLRSDVYIFTYQCWTRIGANKRSNFAARLSPAVDIHRSITDQLKETDYANMKHWRHTSVCVLHLYIHISASICRTLFLTLCSFLCALCKGVPYTCRSLRISRRIHLSWALWMDDKRVSSSLRLIVQS